MGMVVGPGDGVSPMQDVLSKGRAGDVPFWERGCWRAGSPVWALGIVEGTTSEKKAEHSSEIRL